jgi:hypothetical protein
MTPCHFNIRSYLEYYPNISKYRKQIVSDWCYIPDNIDEAYVNNNLKQYNNGKFSRVLIDEITSRDLVISIRLGRDYLGQHRYRLLLGDYFKIILEIILSQSTYSWWAGYLSSAQEIYFPITKDGPWSYGKDQRAKWKDFKHDLMVDEPRYHYVSYKDRSIVGDYKTTRDYLNI